MQLPSCHYHLAGVHFGSNMITIKDGSQSGLGWMICFFFGFMGINATLDLVVSPHGSATRHRQRHTAQTVEGTASTFVSFR